jgi:hypothetical protein
MERVVVRASVVLLLAAGCFSDPKLPACNAGFTSTMLACDDFDRTVGSGWGSADVGGTWQVYPANSLLSVGSGHGNVALATTEAGTLLELDTAPSLDVETRAIVSFDQLPTTGSYAAAVGVRLPPNGGPYYHLIIAVSPGGSSLPTIQVVPAAGLSTTLATAPSPITVSANAGVELSLVATGASPTTLCGKVWLEGTSEPSKCTMKAQDPTEALQGSGISILSTNDLGGAAPTVSFSTFRYLQTGP